MKKSYFTPAFFKFLKDIKANNNRPWFLANKERYEKVVRNPLLDFIGDVGPSLRKISKNIIADNSPTGGSMFRIYRDARFSKDKTPYKTHASARFPTSRDKNAHAPGYYLHLSPGEVF
ncbi:MAG TPA: TIGR02453 family protein, partial [bacterium]